MTADQMVLCYNKGCGKQFDPQQSADGETDKYLVVIAPKQKVEYQSGFWSIKILISIAILNIEDFYPPFSCFSRLFIENFRQNLKVDENLRDQKLPAKIFRDEIFWCHVILNETL